MGNRSGPSYPPCLHLPLEFSSLPSSGKAKVCHNNIMGWLVRVGEWACMPIVTLTNRASMQGMDGAHGAMCCTKVTSELESIVQSPTECNGLSHSGLGCVTLLDMPTLCGMGMGDVASHCC